MEDNRFVIHEHKTKKDTHWDLMLEIGNTLQTYRLDKEPKEILLQATEAVKIFDHSLKFLDYEGPVNKGQGEVHIADYGTYQADQSLPDVLILHLEGHVLRGNFTLKHIKSDLWQFSKEKIEQ